MTPEIRREIIKIALPVSLETVFQVALGFVNQVIVGTLGILYERDVDDKTSLGEAIRDDWAADPIRGKYGVPVACSVLVFFALCCQCASTLAVIRRETKTWRWPALTFVYMTTLAYIGAWLTFQIGRWIVDLT